MLGMTMSVIALLHADHTLFDPLTLPTGMDKDALIQLIISEAAELETAYPHPEIFKNVLSAWSKANKVPWERMWAAENEEYNPIHNYNRMETVSETVAGTSTINNSVDTVHGEDSTETSSGSSDSEATSSSSGNDSGTNINQKAGFNSPEVFSNNDKTTTTGTAETSGNSSTTNTTTANTTRKNSVTDNETGKTETDNTSTVSRTSTTQGNIGVTTTQQMLTSEMEFRKKFTTYSIITEQFVERFCLGVY